MSKPGSLKPPPIDPIRQQLDELDALLQRMLTLPVNAEVPAAELKAAPPPEPEPDPLPPLPPLPPPRTILSPPPPPPPVQSPVPPPPESSPSELPPPRITAPVRQDPPHVRPRRPVWDTPPRSAQPEPSLGMKLLIGFNQAFDAGLGLLGPVGRWVRRPLGRALIGWAGVLCLTAAVVVALLDWLGWTRLP